MHTTHCPLQMGLAWILVLEVCKFVGRKHRRLIYVRAIGPLLVRIASARTEASQAVMSASQPLARRAQGGDSACHQSTG